MQVKWHGWAAALSVAVCGLLLLSAENLVIFARHYFAGRVFPDDFLLTYHAVPYYWIEALKSGQSLDWIPFQAMGYPLYMNLQSGAPYFPLRVFAWLGEEYSLHAAVALQGVHILLGAVGAAICARMSGAHWTASLLAGVIYQGFGGFYSNAQHPDIVRSMSFLPWLCAPVLADWRQDGRMMRLLVLSLPVWTTANWTGGYPGAAIAASFLLGTITVLRLAVERRQWRIGLIVLAAQIAGVLMAGYAVVPAGLDASMLDRARQVGTLNYDYLQARDVLALAFPVDSSFFAHDLSMRSLFIAIPGLAFILAASGRVRNLPLWPLACALAAALIAAGPLHQLLSRIIPFLGVSRFVMADYKGFIALGLIVLGAHCLPRTRTEPVAWRTWPLLFATLLIAGVHVLGLVRGYATADRVAQVVLLLLGAACCTPRLLIRLGEVPVNVAFPVGLLAAYLYHYYLGLLIPSTGTTLRWMGAGCLGLVLIALCFAPARRRIEPNMVLAWFLALVHLLYLISVDRPDRNGQVVALCVVAAATLLALAGNRDRNRLSLAAVFLFTVLAVSDWVRVTWDQRYFAPPIQDGLPWVESVTGPFDQTRQQLKARLTSDACRGSRRNVPPPLRDRAPWAGYYSGEFYLQDHSVQLTRHKRILADDHLKSFAQEPWRMIRFDSMPVTSLELSSATPSQDARCISWKTAGATYRIEARSSKELLVENEVYWNGWSATLVCRSNCDPKTSIQLHPVDVLGFRGWRVPPGLWEMRVRFEPPHQNVAWWVTSFGLLIWFGIWLALTSNRRVPNGRPASNQPGTTSNDVG